MDINNWYALIGLGEKLIALFILIFYMVPRQIGEVSRPKNEFTSKRWRILGMQALITLALLPSLARSYQVILLPIPSTVAAVSSVSTNFAILLFILLFASFYKRV